MCHRSGVAPFVARLHEHAVALGIVAARFDDRRRCAEEVERRAAGAHVPGPIARADADVPGVGDVVAQYGFEHDAVAVRRAFRKQKLPRVMAVQPGEIHQRQIGGVGRQSQPVGQHELAGQADAQRFVMTVLGDAEEIGGEGVCGHAGGGAGELCAVIGVGVFFVIIIADERAQFRGRRLQER